ncbi:MAG: ChaB family protein [Nocardiaceae bacterium]|nr:ChaB family protein [Nocardiaceae bacterium]
MPKLSKRGTVRQDELPDTLKRSPKKAQRTFAKVHDSAAEQYGEGERAHRVAFAALKDGFEKIGDHWEAKDQRGPSDERSESGGPNATGRADEGVNANSTKEHLYEVAKKLDVHGRSTMSKRELVEAIKKENRRRSRKSD